MPEVDIVQLTGFFGGLLWFVGFWLIAHEIKHAFLVSILGEICLGAAGWVMGAYFLTGWCIVWVIQDLLAWRGDSIEREDDFEG